MVPLKQLVKCVTVMAFFSGSIIASDSTDVKITPTGYGALEVGQIEQGYWYAGGGGAVAQPMSHVWQQRAFMDIGYDALVKKRLQLEFTGEGAIAFSTPQVIEPQTMQSRQFFYINSAFALYPFGNIENPYLRIQIGYFPYKYNPDVRNLGEYLFRTNTYPLVVYADFDYPKARLLGGRINLRLLNNILENDFLVNSDLLGVPVQDWSISDIVSGNLFDVMTIGAGISFDHYLSVYQGQYPSKWVDRWFYPENVSDDDASKPTYYIRNNGDSVLFDWKALKTMLRLSFDPKKFIPIDIFGSNDLKLYAESDIIGTKNYPKYYDHIEDRILTSVGFNFPGFKFVDLINIELEYCRNNTAFYDGGFFGSNPPAITPLDTTSLGYKINRDPLRWSVYVKKTILDGHVGFIGQVARDHKKLNFYYFQLANMSFIESLPKTQDLWWVLKTEFYF
jgi:hypothetical protein